MIGVTFAVVSSASAHLNRRSDRFEGFHRESGRTAPTDS